MAATDPRDAILVLTTLPTPAAARAFVRDLVDRRLVACGTVVDGVTSIYRWEGQVEETAEVQVLLKTSRSQWEPLREAMTELHPYDVPEVLGLTIASGLEAYLDWVGSETTELEGGGAWVVTDAAVGPADGLPPRRPRVACSRKRVPLPTTAPD